MRFGAWYAPAVQLGKNIYFCAMPLGSVIGGTFAEEDDVKLGGNVGDAPVSYTHLRSSSAKILDKAGVDKDLKVKDWTDDQAAKIREIIGAERCV